MPKISEISVENLMESFGSREIFRPTWSTSRGAPFCPFRPVVRPKLARSSSKNSPFQLRSYQNLDRDEIRSFFFIRILFSRAGLNILIFPPILGCKYSCIILNNIAYDISELEYINVSIIVLLNIVS